MAGQGSLSDKMLGFAKPAKGQFHQAKSPDLKFRETQP